MSNEKYIVLVEATLLAEFREEVVAAAQESLKHTLQESGVDAFFQTSRDDDPNTLVFFEVFASTTAYEEHMRQDYTQKVFATLAGKLAGPPRIIKLRPLGELSK